MKYLVLLVAVVSVTACSRTGAVEGDTYLRMANGDVKPMASVWVYFAPGDRATRLTQQTEAFCKPLRPILQRMQDSADRLLRTATSDASGLALADARVQLASIRLLRAQRTDTLLGYRRAARPESTQTDMRGHFRFDSLPPGPGMIWADVGVGDVMYDWARNITVQRGGVVKADFNNSNVADGGVCPLQH